MLVIKCVATNFDGEGGERMNSGAQNRVPRKIAFLLRFRSIYYERSAKRGACSPWFSRTISV